MDIKARNYHLISHLCGLKATLDSRIFKTRNAAEHGYFQKISFNPLKFNYL